MAKSETIKVTYKGSVKPNKTSFLTPSEIPMDFEAELELSGPDLANAKAIQKEFQGAMESQLKGQLAGLNAWLSEKDRQIDGMVKQYEAVKKQGFPATPQAAGARAKTFETLAKLGLELQRFPEEWAGMVADWAQNARNQQGLVAMRMAVKAARVTTFSDKNFRVRAGQVVKGVLLVAALAIGIAAIILSAGTATPLVIGIAAAGVALGGIGSIAQFGRALSENATTEKKLIANVSRDIEAVRQAFGTASTARGTIAKHVTELSNLIRVRDDTIARLKADIQKYNAPAKLFADQIGSLKDTSFEAGEIARRRKAIDDVQGTLTETGRKVARLEAQNAGGQALLKDLEAMVGDLDRLSVQPANTLLGNLKTRLTGLDGLAELAVTVGGLANAGAAL